MSSERTGSLFHVTNTTHRFYAFFGSAHCLIFALAAINYGLNDNFNNARGLFGFTYITARASALVLHVDIGLLLFPVCRTLISYLRQTPLNGIIQFDKNIRFHMMLGWSIVFWTFIHVASHWNNFAQLAVKSGLGFKGWLLMNVQTGPGWSGYIMLFVLVAIVLTSIEGPRRKNYERFWYTHHLFVVFFLFWSVHGVFCMIQPDSAPFCTSTGPSAVGTFWQFWMYGGFIYLAERIAREVRGRHKTQISKVIQHPSNVCEIQIRKEHTTSKAGQYIFLCCPAISLWQYHPFTLTSAPEEDYISVHVRCQGNFTMDLSKALGCDWSKPTGADSNEVSKVVGVNPDDRIANPALQRILPRLYIDGPFGSASEDVFKYEVSILVGAGIGVTPFASILKSIWYRLNYPRHNHGTRLQKVYFFWICRDFGSFEWFRSLLLAVEAQDLDKRIEIHTYLTAKIKTDDATNIMINGADAARDAVTGLRSRTSFGRPKWDRVFKGIRQVHGSGEAGVFFCGPKALGSALNACCGQYSENG